MIIPTVFKNNFPDYLSESLDIVGTALKHSVKPVVCCSFGKDSMLVLYLVRLYYPEVTVLFSNSRHEYPDTYVFKNKFVKEHQLNLVEVPGKHTFWWIVERHGFPLKSKGNPYRYSRDYLPAHYCCLYLKKRPLSQYLRREKYDFIFDGMRKEESLLRRYQLNRRGVIRWHAGNHGTRVSPLANLTEQQVYQAHVDLNIPICSLYDKKIEGLKVRSGCWCCTLALKKPKIKFLRLFYPRLWSQIMNRGLAKLIIEKKLNVVPTNSDVSDYIKYRPCFFDSL